ncbi:DUF4365 domain-containing protein [Corynebacterium sp. NML130628]|uniref:DUF4365 domain-containing protein n=1 Tax=Corynebacterium sp. NML130628 TaxID=1906333 RepID=UPI0008FB1F80|nr:DUF4365 domain-containing protein [Corynebacterium sp. NML130628]
MPKISSRHIKGANAESYLTTALGTQGFPVASSQGRDYGIDLYAQVPKTILTAEEVKGLDTNADNYEFEVTAELVNVQVKATVDNRIKAEHLKQWAEAAQGGNTIVLAFVRNGTVELFPPWSFAEVLFDMEDGQKTYDMAQWKTSVVLPLTPKSDNEYNRLGITMHGFRLSPEIELDMNTLLELKPNDWPRFEAFVSDNFPMIHNLILYKYPLGRAYNDALDNGDVSDLCCQLITEMWAAYNGRVSRDLDIEINRLVDEVFSFRFFDVRQSENSINEARTADYYGDRVAPSIKVKFRRLLKILEALA